MPVVLTVVVMCVYSVLPKLKKNECKINCIAYEIKLTVLEKLISVSFLFLL